MSGASDQDLGRWRALVERGLKGAPFESLVARTLEGLEIQPLYTERDRSGEQGIPWIPRHPRLVGPALPDARVESALLERQREGGASAVWIEGAAAIPEPNGITVIAAGASAAGLGSEQVRPIADPWWSESPEAGVVDLIARAAREGRPALGVAGWLWQQDGASAVDEIAAAAASLAASLRALEAQGAPLEAAADGATIGTAIGTDFFMEIGKLRALRRVLDRVLGACGLAARPWIAAVTSTRIDAALDEPTNLLRHSIATAAALVGGADVVCARRHRGSDAALDIARKVPLVLTLESYLDAPSDPAHGSYYVDRLTSALAAAAWEAFRGIERAGGLERAGRDELRARVSASREARASEIRTRKRPLVGVSRFPTREVPSASAPHADGAPFEALRARSAGRTARVVVVGACPPARVDFAREVLEVAGFASASATFADDAAAALDGGSIAVLAAPDASFEIALPAVARALAAAGAKAIAVAGKPGPHEHALRAAGVSAFVYLGADVVAFGESLLREADR